MKAAHAILYSRMWAYDLLTAEWSSHFRRWSHWNSQFCTPRIPIQIYTGIQIATQQSGTSWWLSLFFLGTSSPSSSWKPCYHIFLVHMLVSWLSLVRIAGYWRSWIHSPLRFTWTVPRYIRSSRRIFEWYSTTQRDRMRELLCTWVKWSSCLRLQHGWRYRSRQFPMVRYISKLCGFDAEFLVGMMSFIPVSSPIEL